MSGVGAGGRFRPIGPFTTNGRNGSFLTATGLMAVVVVAVAIVGLLGPGAVRVGAHTDLLQGSPGPGQRVGGTVDFIDLVFVAPVTEVVVEVTGPDGDVIDGEMVVADGQIIRHRMDAVAAEGRYVVAYEMISEDGDLTEDTYFFVYEDGAFQPTRLGRVDIPEESLITGRNVAGAAAVVVLGGVCLVLFRRFRRSRAALLAHRQTDNA